MLNCWWKALFAFWWGNTFILFFFFLNSLTYISLHSVSVTHRRAKSSKSIRHSLYNTLYISLRYTARTLSAPFASQIPYNIQVFFHCVVLCCVCLCFFLLSGCRIALNMAKQMKAKFLGEIHIATTTENKWILFFILICSNGWSF